MRARLVALALAAAVLAATPATPAAGLYVGTGPSDNNGYCEDLTTVTLYPSALSPGAWAAEIDCPYATTFNNPYGFLSVGLASWPSHVAHDLQGSPETGFHDSGEANVHGTSMGTIDWDLTIGPLGNATAWSLHLVFHPDPDWHASTGPDEGWWNGTADFTGTHV